MSTSSAAKLKLVVFLGSCRPHRQGGKVAQRVIKTLQARGHEVTLIDAQEQKLPVLEKPLHHYGLWGDTTPAPEHLVRLGKQISDADALIVVDGEYNHGPTPGMLNLIDHFYLAQYKGKPAGIASYSAGKTGGARAAYVLRNTLAEVGAVTIPTIFNCDSVMHNFQADGTFKAPETQAHLDKFLVELEWFAVALKNQRAIAPTPNVALGY